MDGRMDRWMDNIQSPISGPCTATLTPPCQRHTGDCERLAKNVTVLSQSGLMSSVSVFPSYCITALVNAVNHIEVNGQHICQFGWTFWEHKISPDPLKPKEVSNKRGAVSFFGELSL